MKQYILFASLLASSHLFGMDGAATCQAMTSHYDSCNIADLDKAAVLQILWRAAKKHSREPIYTDIQPTLSKKDIAKVLESRGNYIYSLNGRIIRVNFNNDVIDVHLYNGENGHNVAQEMIGNLQAKKRAQAKL